MPMRTLTTLYPDHFWATNNLVSLYRVSGQERKYLTYVLRRAELRPSSFFFNSRAASEIVFFEGDLVVARSYVNRALNLITSEDIESQWGVGWVMLFPAYEAFLQGDPQTALLEADRMLQTLRRLGVSGRTSSQLGSLYLALGKFQVAQELSNGNSLFLSGAAYLKGNDGAMKKHLREYLESGSVDRVLRGVGGNPMFGPLSPILLVRAGLTSEAEKILHSMGNRLSGKRAKEIQIPLGVLALSRGNITEGMAMIENTLPLVNRPGAAATYFLGCEILAKAWRQQGDLGKAVQLLEEASERKSLLRAQTGLAIPLWMGLRLQLAQFYREMDRSAEARKIEDELRTLLAYADPDHPILRQLDHSEEIALLEPAN